MKKTALFFAAVLLFLFAAVAFLKSGSVAEDTGVNAVRAGEQEKERRFWAFYRAATEHRIAGRLAEAAEAYQGALALNAGHEDARYYLGNVQFERGLFAEAEDAWRYLASLNPNSARAHAQLGNLYLCSAPDSIFDPEAAEKAFARAMEINREETGPLLRLGQVALVRGDLTTAQSYLDAVIGSNYRSVEAYFLKGYIAWKKGDSQQADTLFAQAISYTRLDAPPQGVLGEGDTKDGAGPGLPRTSSCRLFQSLLDGLARAPLAPRPGQETPWYEKLDTSLTGILLKRAAPM